jgi:putative transposon-encoded protein
MDDITKRILSNFANRQVGGIPPKKETTEEQKENVKIDSIDFYNPVKKIRNTPEKKQFYEPEHKKAEEVFDKLFNEQSYNYKVDIFEKMNIMRKAFFYCFGSAINIFQKTVKQTYTASGNIYVPRKYIGCPVTVIIWPKDSGISDTQTKQPFDQERSDRAQEKRKEWKENSIKKNNENT